MLLAMRLAANRVFAANTLMASTRRSTFWPAVLAGRVAVEAYFVALRRQLTFWGWERRQWVKPAILPLGQPAPHDVSVGDN